MISIEEICMEMVVFIRRYRNKNLVDAFGYDRAKENILFSMVYAPPYSEERLEETQKFLRN